MKKKKKSGKKLYHADLHVCFEKTIVPRTDNYSSKPSGERLPSACQTAAVPVNSFGSLVAMSLRPR